MDRYQHPKSRWRVPYPVRQGGRRFFRRPRQEAILAGACVLTLVLVGAVGAGWFRAASPPLKLGASAPSTPLDQAETLPAEAGAPPPPADDEEGHAIEVVRLAPRRVMNDGEVYFRNCDAARAAGAAPIARGTLGYRSALDRDNDGWACEPYRR